MNENDALQIGLTLTEGYTIYLIADYNGLSLVSDETGESVTIGRINWS